MNKANCTVVTELILSTFSDLDRYQVELFVAFLLILIITMFGNVLIIVLICSDIHLQSPMYFFLGNLSFVDICLCLVTVPQMLRNLCLDLRRRVITFEGCIAQIYFFLMFANIEDVLLVVMAYDRYVAICNPLHYVVIMNRRHCIQLVAACWIHSTAHAILHSVLTSQLSYSRSNHINHFLCDIVPLIELSCSDTTPNEFAIFIVASVAIGGPFVMILISYSRIIFTILKMSSTNGRRKVFSTCSSHLAVVLFYFGTIMFIYLRPSSSYSLTKHRVANVVYTILVPMMNPFIYSLRNMDVMQALQRLLLTIHLK